MNITALIVDDDMHFRKILEIRLKSWNKQVNIVTADTLAKARQILDDKTSELSVVLLDQRLPDGMGWELLSHPRMSSLAVLAVSADENPELPAETVRAGAQHFLQKRQVTEALFIPLLQAIIERKTLEAELLKAQIRESRMRTIQTLLSTLQHEINNPLGAVLGGAYLIRSGGSLAEEQAQALKLIEASGNRIKHVIKQLCEAADLEEVTKASESVFHVPGDESWENKNEQAKKIKVGKKEKK